MHPNCTPCERCPFCGSIVPETQFLYRTDHTEDRYAIALQCPGCGATGPEAPILVSPRHGTPTQWQVNSAQMVARAAYADRTKNDGAPERKPNEDDPRQQLPPRMR